MYTADKSTKLVINYLPTKNIKNVSFPVLLDVSINELNNKCLTFKTEYKYNSTNLFHVKHRFFRRKLRGVLFLYICLKYYSTNSKKNYVSI